MKEVKLTLTGYEQFKEFTQVKMATVVKEASFKIRQSIVEEFTQGGFYKNPIDTGHLRNSVGVKEIDPFTYEIGVSTNEKFGDAQWSQGKLLSGKFKKKISDRKQAEEYSKFVEYGTARMKPRPFMRQGVEKAKGLIEDLFKGALGK